MKVFVTSSAKPQREVHSPKALSRVECARICNEIKRQTHLVTMMMEIAQRESRSFDFACYISLQLQIESWRTSQADDDDESAHSSTAQSCCGCKKFNYIIDDRWRLWHYRNRKHEAHDIMQWKSAGLGIATCETYMETNGNGRLSASKQNSKEREMRKEINFKPVEWVSERASERNMNKLKWTVMLIIAFWSNFATPVPASAGWNHRLPDKSRNWIGFLWNVIVDPGVGKGTKSRVEIAVRNKMHSCRL